MRSGGHKNSGNNPTVKVNLKQKQETCTREAIMNEGSQFNLNATLDLDAPAILANVPMHAILASCSCVMYVFLTGNKGQHSFHIDH